MSMGGESECHTLLRASAGQLFENVLGVNIPADHSINMPFDKTTQQAETLANTKPCCSYNMQWN